MQRPQFADVGGCIATPLDAASSQAAPQTALQDGDVAQGLQRCTGMSGVVGEVDEATDAAEE